MSRGTSAMSVKRRLLICTKTTWHWRNFGTDWTKCCKRMIVNAAILWYTKGTFI